MAAGALVQLSVPGIGWLGTRCQARSMALHWVGCAWRHAAAVHPYAGGAMAPDA